MQYGHLLSVLDTALVEVPTDILVAADYRIVTRSLWTSNGQLAVPGSHLSPRII